MKFVMLILVVWLVTAAVNAGFADEARSMLSNGSFRLQTDGKPQDWQLLGDSRWISDGGRNGLPSVEIKSTGDGMNAALQAIRFDEPRKGPFVVSAWIRLDDMGEGGDCGVWLDVMQAGGPPMWGQQGCPRAEAKGWQQVRAEVRPAYPVSEVQVYLILRGVWGRVRFCDVRLEDLPVTIHGLRVFSAGGDSYEVRAELSGYVPWEIVARRQGKEIWRSSGEGMRVAEKFESAGGGQVEVELASSLNGGTARASAVGKPRRAGGGVDWWVADTFTRVFQDDLPPERPINRVTLDAARNERESFQVCIRPYSKPLNGERVTVSDLVGEEGSTISASEWEWYRVGYVWVEKPFAHPMCSRREASWWPDPLLPGVEFSVDAGQVQPLWFTLHIPEKTAPGAYTGRVTLQADGQPAITVPVSLNVHGATVPMQGRMKTAFALMDGHLRKVYGSISKELRRSYTDYLLAHHLNPDDISRTSSPDLDELSYADTRGLNAFNILNVVPEPEDDVLWTCFSPVEAYTPEFRERFFERLDETVPRLEKRGLIDKAYIYGFDERGPEYIPIIKDLFGEIKRRYPRVHTLSTCWPPKGTDPLSMNIDWFVPLSSGYDQQLAKKVRERGGEMWWYICMGPNYPYANWLLENPLVEARLIWWQAFSYDVEGFLYWGLNIWERANNGKPIPSSAGPRLDWSVTSGGNYDWLNGDGVLLYPGERGPIGSVRLENIRDGLEDIELLRLYREKHGAKAVEELVRGVSVDRTHYSRDAGVLMGARAKVLNGL